MIEFFLIGLEYAKIKEIPINMEITLKIKFEMNG